MSYKKSQKRAFDYFKEKTDKDALTKKGDISKPFKDYMREACKTREVKPIISSVAKTFMDKHLGEGEKGVVSSALEMCEIGMIYPKGNGERGKALRTFQEKIKSIEAEEKIDFSEIVKKLK